MSDCLYNSNKAIMKPEFYNSHFEVDAHLALKKVAP